MITFKTLSIRNFMSVGNTPEFLELNTNNLTLILGENLDIKSENARNGAGKTTILNALSYAIFGNAITNIKKDNLINKINKREMLVTLDFVKDNTHYRIERGRKPNVFKWKINDDVTNDSTDDETEGDSKWTQKEIEKVVGLSHTMFKHLIALNTYTDPFLSLPVSKQREIIEELLGITLLSEKAEVLKSQIKNTKDLVNKEEERIKANIENNKRTERMLNETENKLKSWEEKQNNKINDVKEQLNNLYRLDIENEINNHNKIQEINELEKQIEYYNDECNKLLSQIDDKIDRLDKTKDNISYAENNICPMCNQSINDEEHSNVLENLKNDKEKLEKELDELEQIWRDYSNKLEEYKEKLSQYDNKPKTYYKSVSEAENHQNKINQLEEKLNDLNNETNPHQEHLETLRNEGFVEIDYSYLNDLKSKREHEDFLLKLLTNRDSFIRKRIIDQNLSYLNKRLEYYLDIIGMNHKVKFSNDLTVEITNNGEDYDFENLSRGERNRVIISLSLAFRDIYESLRQPYNLIFIDEIIDNGFDTIGMDNIISILKRFNRDAGKDTFLISNREELISRAMKLIIARIENGFTTFDKNVEDIYSASSS